MPIPHNATAGHPYPTYADVVPPYPFDFDFEPEVLVPPSYASLGYSGFDSGAAWQAHGAASEPADIAGEQPMQPECGPCLNDILGAVAVTIQVVGVLALLYGNLGSYSPFGLH